MLNGRFYEVVRLITPYIDAIASSSVRWCSAVSGKCWRRGNCAAWGRLTTLARTCLKACQDLLL